MATCEVCGESGDLLKTKVEGTTLKLCDDCQDLGETVSSPSTTPSPQPVKRSSRRKRSRHEPDDELAEDFSTRVKRAREQKNLSPAELANQIKEKDSVVHRVETGKLSPDKKLVRKLESTLGIDLYEDVSDATGYAHDTAATGSQTLGDVADVRDRS